MSKVRGDELQKIQSILQEYPDRSYTKYKLSNLIYNHIGNNISKYRTWKMIQNLLQSKFLLKNNGEYFINSKR